MLQQRLESQGNWLFRWRSFLPIVMLLPMAYALCSFRYLGGQHGMQENWTLVCFAVALVGLGVRAATVGYAPRGTSGRNTQGQRADSLNTTGMYSLCRNPLYLGNFLIAFGVALFFYEPCLLAVVTLAFWLYYERIIMAEEAYLRGKFGDEYMHWAEETPVFLPRLYGWRRPDLPFSWRNVLRREYSAFFLIIGAFYALEVAEHLVLERRLVLIQRWGWIFLFGLTVYLLLRTLKKHTRVLDVDGR